MFQSPEPRNVLFGKKGLCRCHEIEDFSRGGHPRLSGWTLNPVTNVFLRMKLREVTHLVELPM